MSQARAAGEARVTETDDTVGASTYRPSPRTVPGFARPSRWHGTTGTGEEHVSYSRILGIEYNMAKKTNSLEINKEYVIFCRYCSEWQ